MPLYQKNEKIGYFEDWTAGYGLPEIAQFLIQKSKDQPVVVGTEGSFGTLPDGLEIYLNGYSNIAVIGGDATISSGLRHAAIDHPTYFVADKSRFSGASGTNLIAVYPKYGQDLVTPDAIELFQVFPSM